MQVWIISGQPFYLRRGNKVAIGRDKRQARQTTRQILLVDDQGCREMDGIIAAQPMILGQANRPIEHDRVRPDQSVFGRTVSRQQIDGIVSFRDGYTTRRSLACCNCGSGFNLRELGGDDCMTARRIG